MIVRRSGATPKPAAWYIKGSYVLDKVFNTSHAKDVDVFFTGDRPAKADILLWLQAWKLPEPPFIEREQFLDGGTKTRKEPCFDVHPVDSLAKPDGGGEMVFNVDCWHFAMSGQVHIFDPARAASAPAAPGTHPGVLSRLDPTRAVAVEPGLKGLLKMLLYPLLKDAALAATLVDDARQNLADRPGGNGAAEAAVTLLDEMLRGVQAEDQTAARAALKLAEDELRER